MLTTMGGFGSSSGLAFDVGRSTFTPAVIIGAATMNTISSTSITSTSGVTLMSLTGPTRCDWPDDNLTPISSSLRRQRRHVVRRALRMFGFRRRRIGAVDQRQARFKLARQLHFDQSDQRRQSIGIVIQIAGC